MDTKTAIAYANYADGILSPDLERAWDLLDDYVHDSEHVWMDGDSQFYTNAMDMIAWELNDRHGIEIRPKNIS